MCVQVRVCPNVAKVPPACQTDGARSGFALTPRMCIGLRAPALALTHSHTNVCVRGASVNDGWQYDVCVRSKRIGITTWAKSAANSSRL